MELVPITAADLEGLESQLDASALQAPAGGPYLPICKYIPRSGSPNRLLEAYTPLAALRLVTEAHQEMADWIRGQRGKAGWDLDRPTRHMWPYINVSKRLKRCRDELQAMIDEINLDLGLEDQEDAEWLEAQAEADALSAQDYIDMIRSGWPGEGMHA